MRSILVMLAIGLSLWSVSDVQARSSGSSHSIRSYTKKNGTHVQASHATNPNKTQRDNYSTKGNVNPHNGKVGTKKAKH